VRGLTHERLQERLDITAPIVGASKMNHLEDAIAAADPEIAEAINR
jgi:aryl-alcohol dehydrogenase-like predicted oxidoreductase